MVISIDVRRSPSGTVLGLDQLDQSRSLSGYNDSSERNQDGPWGATPRRSSPQYLAITGDSLVITDNRAVLLLRHGAR